MKLSRIISIREVKSSEFLKIFDTNLVSFFDEAFSVLTENGTTKEV